ncbi:MAG: ATP-binding protein [Acidobacteriota bacterium]
MYERALAQTISGGRKSILLLGPRQVGKSVLLSSLRPDLTINLASPESFREYAAHPERLERELRAARTGVRTVFLDEVQRVPALLDAVQVICDEMPGRFRFLLSGSSARKLRRGQANLLPGRVNVHYLHPLLACELGEDFDLDRVLSHGSLPGIYSEANPSQRAADLRSYADTYLREEIQAEALVRQIGTYARLLELMAASSGRVLNLNALCGDAGVRYETARRYVEILEDTLVAFRAPAWSGSALAGLVAHPKIFLFDLGVRNAILRRPLDRPLEDERGLLLEHLVAYEIYRRAGSLWPDIRLCHYRSRAGAEVDFVVEIGRDLWAVEVKASSDTSRVQTHGFESLANHAKNLRRKIVVFLGCRRQIMDDVEILPMETFLEELPC